MSKKFSDKKSYSDPNYTQGEIYRLAKKNGKLEIENDRLKRLLNPLNIRYTWGIICFGLLICVMAYLCYLCFLAGYEIKALEDSFGEVSGAIQEERQQEELNFSSLSESNVPNLANFNGIITAYTTHDEGVNCTSASGENLCQSTGNYCACPSRYEFGTKFLIDDKVWICQDRMAERYRDGNYFDLFYYDDLESAYRFGRQTLEVIEL